jgi:hypothetical protein
VSEKLSVVGKPGVNVSDLIHGDTIPDTGHRYSELFERYCSSEYGIFHATQDPRFANYYDMDHSQMLIDLGDDVHPVRHMTHTERNIVRPLLELQHLVPADEVFTPQQIVAIRWAALVHDMGECEHPALRDICGETVGDVYFAARTDAHEKAEAKIRAHLYDVLYGDVPPKLLEAGEDIVCNPETSFAGHAFQTAEHIGYFTTGILAGVKAMEIKDLGVTEVDEQRFDQLSKLAVTVSARWHPKLEEHGERFPYAASVAAAQKPTLDLIQACLG